MSDDTLLLVCLLAFLIWMVSGCVTVTLPESAFEWQYRTQEAPTQVYDHHGRRIGEVRR